MPERKHYSVEWEGQVYDLSLRTAPDGYLTGADRAAAEVIISAYLGNAGTIMGQEDTTNRLFALLARVERNGERVTPPWPSWLDIPEYATGGLLEDFFFSFTTKASQSPSSSRTTAILTALRLIFDPTTSSGTASSAPPEISEMPSGSTSTGAASM